MARASLRYEARLQPALNHIRSHLSEPLRLERLARLSHLSKYHFHRVFKAIHGETAREHVTRLRLEKAVLLIRSSANSLADIALATGFSSQSALNRDFRRRFGMSPGKARRIYRQRPTTRLRQAPQRGESDDVEGRIRIVRTPARDLLCRTRHGRYDFRLGWTYVRLMARAGALGCLSPDSRKMGIIYDDPEVSPRSRCRFDAAITLSRRPAVESDGEMRHFPACICATLRIDRAFSILGPALDAIYANWLVVSDFEPDDLPPFILFEGSLHEYQDFRLCVPIRRDRKI